MLRRIRTAVYAGPRFGRSPGLISLVTWVLLGAFSAQAVQAPPSSASDPAGSLPEGRPGPTEAELQSAFAGRSLHRMDPARFERFVSLHSGQGRLLTGPALAAVLSAAEPGASGTGGAGAGPANGPSKTLPSPSLSPPKAKTAACDSLPARKRSHCRDSLEALARAKADSILEAYGVKPSAAAPESRAADTALPARAFSFKDSAAASPDTSAPEPPRALRESGSRSGGGRENGNAATADTLILGEGLDPDQGNRREAEHTYVDREETRGWFYNLFADWSEDGGGGGGGSGDGKWAAIIYVVVGVVVVGAFVLYAAQTLYELSVNEEDYPLFMETGLRLSYSGQAWRDPSGVADLYRDVFLAGLRFAIGFDRPGMGLGLSLEGGYIDVSLRGISDPSRSFEFNGAYLVAGPLLRFGRNDPFSFTLEFLNGTSSHASIGWISKSRMTLQGKVGAHALVGGHLGAVFYDLHFLDGLGWRQGNFNRDLSLVYGLDAGWEF